MPQAFLNIAALWYFSMTLKIQERFLKTFLSLLTYELNSSYMGWGTSRNLVASAATDCIQMTYLLVQVYLNFSDSKRLIQQLGGTLTTEIQTFTWARVRQKKFSQEDLIRRKMANRVHGKWLTKSKLDVHHTSSHTSLQDIWQENLQRNGEKSLSRAFI